jgi:hypothetical protein
MRKLAIAIAIFLTVFEPAWAYDTAWSHYLSITVDATKVPGDLTNYTVLVDLDNLSTGHNFWTTAQSDGDDLRFTKDDGTTELAYELVAIDTTAKTGEVHVLYAGTLSSSSDTVIRMYYGNAGASPYAEDATYGAEAAWDSNYVMVQHLQGASYTAQTDSTSNDNDITAEGGDPTYQQSAQIGYGIAFDGTGDYISAPDVASVDFDISDPFTLSYWIKTATSATMGALAKWDGTDGWHTFIYNVAGERNMVLQFSDGAAYRYVYGDTNLSDNAWHFVSISHDGTNTFGGMDIYVDGTEESYTTGAAGTVTSIINAQVVSIGARLSGTPLYFNGSMDDVRISNVVRGANWHATLFNNSLSSFISYGSHTANVAASSFIPRIIIID